MQITGFFENLKWLINCVPCDYENGKDKEIQLHETMIDALKGNGYDIEKIMFEVAHSCESMFKMCKWKTKVFPCKELFRSIKTSAGVCCSFNYFGDKNIE